MLEEEFYKRVNLVISKKVTPTYNVIMLLYCSIFGYYILKDDNQCYARDMNAWAIQYSNTEDVTHQWYLLQCAGIVLLLISVLLYQVASSPDMFHLMRPYVICINLITLVWFVSLQYYRFKDTGRACAGDFLTRDKKPGNYTSVYLESQGEWLRIYIISHYCVYIIQKLVSIVITNKLEADFERKRSEILNKV